MWIYLPHKWRGPHRSRPIWRETADLPAKPTSNGANLTATPVGLTNTFLWKKNIYISNSFLFSLSESLKNNGISAPAATWRDFPLMGRQLPWWCRRQRPTSERVFCELTRDCQTKRRPVGPRGYWLILLILFLRLPRVGFSKDFEKTQIASLGNGRH